MFSLNYRKFIDILIEIKEKKQISEYFKDRCKEIERLRLGGTEKSRKI